MKVAIIGAGAAGSFCAANLVEAIPGIQVDVYEAQARPMAKLAITGGGRCNLTNTFKAVSSLAQVYPRGDKLMRRALSVFSQEDVKLWFERHGVSLVEQEDECIFPQSQDAMQIVNTLLTVCVKGGVRFHYGYKINDVTDIKADKIIVAIGGQPHTSGFKLLDSLSLRLEESVPSLFTFNIEGNDCRELMGTVVEGVSTMIAGTKFRAFGPLLLTHWGMSGPAILKLSSHAARYLSENGYKATLVVNWYGERGEDSVREELASFVTSYADNLVTNRYPSQFVQRHWLALLRRAQIPFSQRWGAMNKTLLNRLLTVLSADTYKITGRCHYKEEFVTCGGVSLKEINPNTMALRRYADIYVIGEATDVDAVTGGFNLQAAWSMAMCVVNDIKNLVE